MLHTATTLLSLPAELRLRIYEFVCAIDIDCIVLYDIEHYFRRGTKAILHPEKDNPLAANVPWLNLMLTCKIISSEIKRLMRASTFLANPSNAAYILDLHVYNDAKLAIRKVAWRNIPCPPALARSLEINISAAAGPGPWTDGGSTSLIRAIYQILNHTHHNGPSLARRRPLTEHMQLRDVIINIDIGKPMRPPRLECNIEPEYNYSDLIKGFRQVVLAGLPFGLISNMKIRQMDHEDSVDIRVGSRAPIAMFPGGWENYGFQWGV